MKPNNTHLFYIYDEQRQEWGNTPYKLDAILSMENITAESYIISYDRKQVLKIKDILSSPPRTTHPGTSMNLSENSPTCKLLRVACCIYIATNIMGAFAGLGIGISSMFRHPKPVLGSCIGLFFGIFATYIILRHLLNKTK